MYDLQDSMLGRLLQPELRAMIREKNFKELRATVSELDPADIAEAIFALTAEESALLFRILPRSLAADIFEHLQFQDQEELLRSLGQEQVAAILNEMDPDDRTALLEELPGKVTNRLLRLLTPEERSIAVNLLGYPEESIGRRMTPEYVAVGEDWTVQEVLDNIRRYGKDKETVNVIYVVGENDVLIDDIRLQTIIVSDPNTKVSELMDRQFVALSAMDDQETAIEVMTHYDRFVLPVIDTQGVLVGIVTADDIFDVVEVETTEDIHRLGGLEALDAPYSTVSFFTMIKKRAGWLTVLFLGATFTIWAMEMYHEQISELSVLTFFIPLIISSGGNSGSQVTSLVIRAMAVQEIHMRDWYRVLGRELMTGILLGCILGGIALARIYLFPDEGISAEQILHISITVSIAVICVVVFGTMVGCMLPFALRLCGFDPAFSSAPLVATILDLMGVIIYFSVAKFILSM